VRRRPPERAWQLPPETAELRVQLVQAARRADGRAVVAQVPLDLALDGRPRVGGEVDAPPGIEPVDCLDQPDRPDLLEVVDVDALARVLASHGAHQREVLLDQALARSSGGSSSAVNRRLLLPVIVVDMNEDLRSTLTSSERNFNRIAQHLGSRCSRKGI
jgi:hypothetical protein